MSGRSGSEIGGDAFLVIVVCVGVGLWRWLWGWRWDGGVRMGIEDRRQERYSGTGGIERSWELGVVP